jgi:hypothetical protein
MTKNNIDNDDVLFDASLARKTTKDWQTLKCSGVHLAGTQESDPIFRPESEN